jgi:iron complex outermembrane recepter protein
MKTHFSKAVLLASTFLSTAALAQTVPPAPAPNQTVPAAADQNQTAQAATDQTQNPGLTTPTNIGNVQAGGGFPVTPEGVNGTDAGGGHIIEEDAPKNRSTVTQDSILKQYPTANVYKYLELQPGVNVSNADPFGETGGNILVRGMNSNEMGFTLEGAPLNDQATYNFFPQQYVDGENLNQISLAQGSADLDSPHIGASGGVVNMYLRDPSKTPEGLAEFSFGSDHFAREFARADTGLIDGTNVRGFMSYSHLDDDHWRGPGTDDRDHIDIKLLGEFGEGNRTALSLMLNQNVNTYYFTPTLGQWNNHQINWDATFSGATDTNFFGLHENPYLSAVVSMPTTFQIAGNSQLDVTPYVWWDDGAGGGLGSAPAINPNSFFFGNQQVHLANLTGPTTSSGAVLVSNASRNPEVRPGVVFEDHTQIDNHKLVGGYWFEYSMQHSYAPYTLLNANGTLQDIWAETNQLTLTDGQVPYSVNQRTASYVNGVFVGDTMSLLDDRVEVDYGVKRVYIWRSTENLLPGTTNVDFNDAQWSPNAALRYKINPENQVFANFATNFRSPPVSQMVALYSNSTGLPSTIATNADKDEYSYNQELGYRYQGAAGDSSISFFHYDFYNRQLTTANPSGQTITLNVGNTDAYGIDFEAGTHPYYHFRPYVSGEWLRATQTSSYQDGTDYLPTTGKETIRSPHWQGAVSIDYDDGTYFGIISGKYVGPQFSTFIDDEKIPGYATADLTLGVRVPPPVTYVKGMEFRLNLVNITDNRYIAGVNTPEPNAHTQKGVYGTSLAGTLPNYIVGAGFAAIFTMKADF